MEPSLDSAPVPVVALSYQEQAGTPWEGLATVVRGVSMLMAVQCGFSLGHYAFQVACFAWQSEIAPQSFGLVDGVPLVAALPAACVTGFMLAGSVGCVRLREAGRRSIVPTVAVAGVLGPLLFLFDAFYYHVTRQYARYGPALVTYSFGEYGWPAISSVVSSVALWRFYRHPAVRRVFHTETSDAGLGDAV